MTKKIKIEKSIKDNGMFTVNDETWEIFLSFNNGTFLENETNFILTTNENIEFIFQKNSELLYSKIYNNYLNADLGVNDLYESTDTGFGTIVLYIPKQLEIIDKPVISSIGGIMGGSSIWLKLENQVHVKN